MRKADIETSYHQGYNHAPMVNVKARRWSLTEAEWSALTAEFGAEFKAWCEQREANDPAGWERDYNSASEWAAQSLWELAQSDAEEILGDHVKVYSAGRSSGWAVVEALPDIDTWDAIAVARWARFAKVAREIADDWQYSTYWHLAANVYKPERETHERIQQVSEGAEVEYWTQLGIAR